MNAAERRASGQESAGDRGGEEQERLSGGS
jgi:hypothetical protein